MAKSKKIWIILGGLGTAYACNLLFFTGSLGFIGMAFLLECAYVSIAAIVFIRGTSRLWKKVLIISIVLIASISCYIAVSQINKNLIKHSAIQAHKNNDAAFYIFPFDFKKTNDVFAHGEVSQFRSNYCGYGVCVFEENNDRFFAQLID